MTTEHNSGYKPMLAVGLLHPSLYKATGAYAKASATACAGRRNGFPTRASPIYFVRGDFFWYRYIW